MKLFCLTFLSLSLAVGLTGCNSPKPKSADTTKNVEEPCKDQFFMGVRPTVKPSMKEGGQFLCFNGFAVMYSGKSKTPLWSAEHLTKNRLMKASKLERVNNFHEEEALPKSYRAKNEHYSRTGYDRGHLAPNADMYDTKSQYDSFSLANIAPQAPENNRGDWANLESHVRNQTYKYGEAYVVTGVLFTGEKIHSINGVLVPTHFFKAVYYPKINKPVVYVTLNTNDGRADEISLSVFKQRTQIDPFPMLKEGTQQQVIEQYREHQKAKKH